MASGVRSDQLKWLYNCFSQNNHFSQDNNFKKRGEYSMKKFLTAEEANSVLDKYISKEIENYLKTNVLHNYSYTHEDLNKKINEDETLLEFIRDSEIAFSLDEVNLDQMTTEELNMYILKLDTMYIYLEVQEPMWYLKQS